MSSCNTERPLASVILWASRLLGGGFGDVFLLCNCRWANFKNLHWTKPKVTTEQTVYQTELLSLTVSDIKSIFAPVYYVIIQHSSVNQHIPFTKLNSFIPCLHHTKIKPYYSTCHSEHTAVWTTVCPILTTNFTDAVKMLQVNNNTYIIHTCECVSV